MTVILFILFMDYIRWIAGALNGFGFNQVFLSLDGFGINQVSLTCIICKFQSTRGNISSPKLALVPRSVADFFFVSMVRIFQRYRL